LTEIDIAYTDQCVRPDFLHKQEFSGPRTVKTHKPYRLHHPGNFAQMLRVRVNWTINFRAPPVGNLPVNSG